MAPVVSAALGALGPLLGKLTGLLAGEYGRLKGVRREIRYLKSELTCMHAALEEYTELEDPSGQVKVWISLVRELAYDTEDVFDKFINQLGKGGFKEFLHTIALPLKTLGARRTIADQIDDLKARIKQVKELKDSYKLDGATCNTSRPKAADPRLCALFAEEAHLVGVDGPKDELAKWMMDEGNSSFKDRKVLSIVGFGGLGKTTLANEVYRKISGNFDCQAFVSVSQKPDVKKIIHDVISQVSRHGVSTKDTSDWDENRSIAKLRELLLHKRYLIIIDDIWSTQAWNAIKCAFPENHCSSRIIATTRIIDVAKSCCPSIDDCMYEMEALDDLHSQRLFFKRIFGSENDCPDTLKEVSSEILKKCGGLPLAIISISSLLANKSAVEDWEKVKRSIGYALEKNQSLEGMNSILSLSYNDLPPNLKTCLLYLSVFPEDYEIDRTRLVRRWIAEGFISEERGQSREEVAENYFYELINKSMLQPVQIGYDGKVHSCRVHDMMLEILISKSHEDNFVTVVGGVQTNFANRQGFIRRLSIQYFDQELASALANEDLSHVRSLTVTPSCGIKHLPSLVQFETLRVLDFQGCEDLDDYDMKGIDKFHQLKYFSARDTDLRRLPSSIVVLDNLDTLDLGNASVEHLPAGIPQLTKLRHLIGGWRIPNGIGDMRKLQLMSEFFIYSSRTDAVEDLGNLTSLEELDVYLSSESYYSREVPLENRRCEEAFLSALCKLGTCKLRTLAIGAYGYPLDFLDSWSPPPSSLQMFTVSGHGSWFKNFPRWITPALTNLVELGIRVMELTDDDLLTLGKLPSLLYLRLELQKSVTVQGFSSPSLKVFYLHCKSGVYFAFVEGSMPRLENLDISFSVSMARTDGFYLGIEHLPCLKVINVTNWNEGATTCETKAAAAAIRNEAATHPNHPIVNIPWHPCVEDNEEADKSEEKSKEEEN